ncbi:DUF255 domain-containing protein [Pedobacter sp. HMF7056]|uniref:DUF255 domain-containing protein n=2 Tax=Hufsiella ginkgonis TaxID=2695274 RepID=A0A7K1XVA3_9SPHI|nr:DUF255 domain-containing protein [Hufsiella ginkgonis]
MKIKTFFRVIFFAVIILVSGQAGAQTSTDTVSTEGVVFGESEPVATDNVTATDSLNKDTSAVVPTTPQVPAGASGQGDGSLWGIFILGVIGGLAAFFMPCIYPMVPLTISFFTKRAETKGKGIQGAVIYGLSIVVIYVALGLLITALFGPGALNELSTDGYFNLFIFAVLVIFGISFLGAFEINLPSSLVNSLDAKSESKGLLGIFFMAATLSVVSFSCTGPLIGGIILNVANGAVMGPAVAMLGFSGTLALIFMVFAIFPGLMSSLPKSGGWLNSVKVILGFVELALSLKFLSGADLAFGWEFLDREVFLAIWIVLSALAGFYLLGKIKLPHDSDLKNVAVPRLLLSVIVFAFTVYLIPGLWGAPLKVISGLSPAMGTQDFVLTAGGTGSASAAHPGSKKYSDLFHKYTPHGIDAFYDYDEGLAYAKSVNKPVFLDFTGEQCVNCREMEQDVWSNPEVLKRLKNDYVVISLFTDSKEKLPESEFFQSAILKTQVNSVGKKFKHLQATRFNTIAQPFYVLANTSGEKMVQPSGADFNVESYIRFLDSGLAAFRK